MSDRILLLILIFILKVAFKSTQFPSRPLTSRRIKWSRERTVNSDIVNHMLVSKFWMHPGTFMFVFVWTRSNSLHQLKSCNPLLLDFPIPCLSRTFYEMWSSPTLALKSLRITVVESKGQHHCLVRQTLGQFIQPLGQVRFYCKVNPWLSLCFTKFTSPEEGIFRFISSTLMWMTNFR